MARLRPEIRIPSGRGGGSYLLAAVACALALFLLAGSAAAIFGEPETISPPGVEASGPQIATDERDNAIAVWTAGPEGAHEVQAAFRPEGGPWGPVQTLSVPGEDSTEPQVVFDERDNALMAWTSFQTSPADPLLATARVRASFRPRGGSFEPSQVVHQEAGEVFFFEPRLAIDESAALVWSRFEGSTTQVQEAFRPKGGSFGTVQTLAEGTAPDVAVDERGNSIAVWTGPAQELVSSFRPRTGSFGAPAPISDGPAELPRIATDDDNNALVVWSENLRVMSSFRPAGRSFGAKQLVSTDGADAFDADLAFEDEDALIGWSEFDGSNLRVRAAARTKRGVLTAPETLSAAGGDAFEPQVAVDDGAAVVWTRIDTIGNQRVQGAFRAEHRRSFGSTQTLSEPRFEAFEPDVAIDDDGNALSVWTFDANPDPALLEPQIQFSLRPAAGTFTEPAPISSPDRLAFQPRIATDEWGNALAVWVEDDEDGTNRVRAAFRPAGLALEFPQSWTLSEDGADASEPQVVFDERGNALVVWVRADPEGDGDSRVESAFRPKRGSFGTPTLVSSAEDGVAAFGVRVAIDESATAVWGELEGFTVLRAVAAFRPKGGSFGTPVALSAQGSAGFEPDVAVDEHGNSVVVWTEGDLFSGGEPTVMWAFKPRTKGFGPAALLSPAGVAASGARLATDDHSNALAVWVAGDGEPFVQAAFRRVGKGFGTAQTLSEAGADEPKVVFDERRNALAVWTRFVGDAGQIEAAFRPRYGGFGTPEVISPDVPGATHFGPEVAIDESAAVVWTRALTTDTEGSLRVLSAFRPKGRTFGSVETLSDRDLFAFEPHVAVDERGNALAVWTQADAVEPNVPSLSLVQFAFRLRK
ncbi:MAG: hypothetical protein ACRDLQ_09090 [Solirubrobacterales bacterium]